MKVRVTCKNHKDLYGKELYVLWTSKNNKGLFYHCSEKENDVACQVYLGESQVEICK